MPLIWRECTASDWAANAMPFAEKLARDGVILTNYHAAPSCTMSRSMLLTGRHHASLGIDASSNAINAIGVPPDVAMLPQFVEAAVPGTYKKSFVGKWSVGSAVHEMDSKEISRPSPREFFLGFKFF